MQWQSSDRSAPTPTKTSTNKSSHSATSQPKSTSGGLSTGAKAAIGVVVPVAVIAILVGIFFFWRRKIRKLNDNSWPEPPPSSDVRHSGAQSLTTNQSPPMEARTYYKNIDDRGSYSSPPRELDASPRPLELEGSKIDRAGNN